MFGDWPSGHQALLGFPLPPWVLLSFLCHFLLLFLISQRHAYQSPGLQFLVYQHVPFHGDLILCHPLKYYYSQVWWHTTGIPAPGRLRQRDCHESQDNLGNSVVSFRIASYRVKPVSTDKNTREAEDRPASAFQVRVTRRDCLRQTATRVSPRHLSHTQA